MWFRRDLRLADNPALCAAAAGGVDVIPLFVLDPALWGPSGPVRRAWLVRSLAALAERTGGLVVRHGDPAEVVPALAREAGASEIHVSEDFGPYGAARDARTEQALRASGVPLVRTGSPYAVSPGRVRKTDGTPYQVWTPYNRAWAAHGWRDPVAAPAVRWRHLASEPLPEAEVPEAMTLPEAGEPAALAHWDEWRATRLASYDSQRDRPDLDTTSQLSVHLKYGEIHPRTLLRDLADVPPGSRRGAEVFRRELSWREFYADVLATEPQTARESLRAQMRTMQLDEGPASDERFAAWAEGRTGYPFVDAGMRQLRGEGWVHNRVRMVVASFLVKDLHIDWVRGADHFMHWLRDGDLASNAHGWQWVAGTGTDAAPYFRVFNPVSQGQRFDPDGDYVRRWVPELRQVAGAAAHQPWTLPGGVPAGYPERVVEHAAERREALRRYEDLRA